MAAFQKHATKIIGLDKYDAIEYLVNRGYTEIEASEVAFQFAQARSNRVKGTVRDIMLALIISRQQTLKFMMEEKKHDAA